jgi:hypothetical protein
MKLPDRFALEWFRNTLAFADVLIPVRVQDDDDVKDDDEDEDEDDEVEDEDDFDEDDEAADEDADEDADEEPEEEASHDALNRSPRRLFWAPPALSR